MTIRLATAAELGYNDLITVSGQRVAVRTVKAAELVYRGRTFPVVYVGGVCPGGSRASAVMMAGAELFVARRTRV